MSLISPSELAAIQAVGRSGMTSTAIILTRATVQTDDGQASVWATSAVDVPCWVVGVTPNSATLGDVAGAVDLIQTFVIRLPVGTAVESGDQIVVGAKSYMVEQTNNEDTYPDWLSCSCRSAAV